jgi:hypothetical protein
MIFIYPPTAGHRGGTPAAARTAAAYAPTRWTTSAGRGRTPNWLSLPAFQVDATGLAETGDEPP